MDFEPFHIDTKGLCLLCLSECSENGNESSHSDTVNSFKMLLRYLNVSIYDMYNFSPSFLQSIGASDNTSQVDTALCNRCMETAKHFAKLYLEMEVIHVRLDRLIQSLYNSIRKCTSDPGLMEDFRNRLRTTKTMMGMINANAAEKLREEALQKCSSKVEGLAARASGLKRDLALLKHQKLSDSIPEAVTQSQSITASSPISRLRRRPGPKSKSHQSQYHVLRSARRSPDTNAETVSSMVKLEPTTTLEMNATNFTFPDLGDGEDQYNSGIMEGGNDPLSEDNNHGPRIMSASSIDKSSFHPEIELENENYESHQTEEKEERNSGSDMGSVSSNPITVGYDNINVNRRGRRPGGTSSSYAIRKNREGLFECPLCHKGFKSSSHCRRHYETIHLNIRKYKCSVCEQRFKRVEQLKFHFTSQHQGLKYSCPYCTKSSSYEKFIKSHIIMAHPEQHNRDLAQVVTTTDTTDDANNVGDETMETENNQEEQDLNFLL